MRKLLFATVFLFVATARIVTAQSSAKPVNLSESHLAKIVRIVLRSEFKPSREGKVIYLAEDFFPEIAQDRDFRTKYVIKKRWLPQIRGIEFVLTGAVGLSKLGKAYFFKQPVRQRGKIEFDFGYGDKCSAGGGSYFFRLVRRRVHALKDAGGWGWACGSSGGISTGH